MIRSFQSSNRSAISVSDNLGSRKSNVARSVRLGDPSPHTVSQFAAKLAVILAGLALFLAWEAPAAAQRTGSRLGRDATAKDGVTAVRLIAECYYDRNSKNARAVMLLLPGQPEERKIFASDADNLSPCLDRKDIVFDGKEVAFQPPVIRRALGAALARRLLLVRQSVPAPPSDSKPWFYEPLSKMPAGAPVDKSSLALQEFGHCVAVAKWEESIALIKSADGSNEETAAVNSLLPMLGTCIDEGVTFDLTKRNLREIIGEPVYHLLLAASPPDEKQ